MNEFIFKLFFNNIPIYGEGYFFHLFNVSVGESGIPALDQMLPIYLISLVWVIASYLIGSINSSVLISRIFFHDDIRKYGSKNAGTTNMNRTYGTKVAVITLLGDMLKGVIAVLPALILLGHNVAYLCALVCILGHCFPIYFGFKGGKGVATAAAVVLVLDLPSFLVLLILFVSLVVATRYISLGSIMIAVFFPVVLNSLTKLFTGDVPTAMMSICAIGLAVTLVFRHKGNIKKLLNKTESKFSFRKKGEQNDSDASKEAGEYRSLHHIDDADDDDQ